MNPKRNTNRKRVKSKRNASVKKSLSFLNKRFKDLEEEEMMTVEVDISAVHPNEQDETEEEEEVASQKLVQGSS